MIGSIVIKANPVLAWESYHRELHRAYQGGVGFSGYKQTIRAVGGFWQMSFTMHDRLASLVEFQNSGHGRHVEVYGERGIECWEGLVIATDLDLSKQRGLPGLEVTCWGYFRTLYWMTYNQTVSTGNDDLDDVLAAIVTAAGQFVLSSSIEANTTQVTQEYDADRLAGDILVSLTSLGDSAYNRYVIGMYEGRRLIYERAAKSRIPGV